MRPEIIAERLAVDGSDFWTIYYCTDSGKEVVGQVGVKGNPKDEFLTIRNIALGKHDINYTQAIKQLNLVLRWVEDKTRIVIKKKTSTDETKQKSEIAAEYTEVLLGQFFIKTIQDTKEIYYFNFETGLYEPAQRMLETKIQNDLKEESTNTMVEEVLGRIRRITYIPRGELNDPYLFPLENGIYDFKNKTLIQYAPQHFFLAKHPVHYDAMALCPAINKFLDEVTEGDIEKQKVLDKVAAYCFVREMPIQQAIMLFGVGSNGKSVYLNLVRAMLGNESVVSVSLQRLVEDRFMSSKLYLKNANIMSDIEKRALKDDGPFKALTGEDWLTADQKFKEPFDFRSFAKLLFSCNTMPEVRDPNDAFFRRWVIVEFTKQFLPGKQDSKVLKRITSPEERSGYFNQIMVALDELLEQGRFNEDTIDEVRNKWLRNSNSTNAFCYEQLELADEDKELKDNLWEAYLSFCEKNKLAKMIDKQFWRTLHNYFEGKTKQGRMMEPITNERKWVIFGVHLKRDEVDEVQTTLPDNTVQEKVLAFIDSKGDRNLAIEDIYSEFTYIAQDDLLLLIKQLKREGVLYEPVHGFIRRDKK